ncbi:hypothetical protein [Cellulophaga sp. Ld12]|uniref:hypothetical protein n=1 Tax=Cellulophaga sp. Ld12 TaxID=3229535 RepID=UPI00386BDC32
MKVPQRRHLKLNLIWAILVFCLPLLLYVYLLFPEVKVFNVWNFTWETIEYINISNLMYYIFVPVYVLCYLSIWFLAITDNWCYMILPNIIYFWYQIVVAVSNEFAISSIIYELSILLGIFYCLFLYFFKGRIKLSSLQNISPQSFDIIKILNHSIKEKSVFSNMSVFKKQENIERSIGIKNLHERIKHLETLLSNTIKAPFFQGVIVVNKKSNFIIGTILLVAPFLLFLYKWIPSNSKTIDLYIFSYETNFPNAKIFMYFFMNKLYNLILLSVWFFTTKGILKYGIFFNIIMVVFQITQGLNNTESKVDESELITALPIMIPILLTFLLLHRIIKYKSKNDILNEEIEEEIRKVLTAINTMEEDENSLVAELISLRENQSNLSKAAYQQELLRIKAAIERKIATD